MSLVACGGKSKTPAKPKVEKPRTPMSLMAKTANYAVVVRPNKLDGTKIGELAQGMMGRLGSAKQLLAACAVNPLKDIQLFIMSGDAASDHGTAFVKGTFTKKQVDDCLAKIESSVPGLKVARAGDIVELSMGENKLYARWVLGGILASGIKARVDMTQLEGPSAELEAKLATFKADALLSFAALSGALKDEETPVGKLPPEARPSSAHGNVVLSNGIAVDISAGMSSDGAAKTALTKLQGMLEGAKKIPMLGAMIGGVKLATSGSNVTLDVALSDDQINMLIGAAKMFMSM